MLRQKLMGKTNPSNTTFRLRGDEVQRIEGFSDAVFGFTVTLLVVSLEVPKTFSELLNTMHDFFAFAVGFTLLVAIWYWQYLFFRRYGLRDTLTIALNAVLLFMVLFYAYPLKFLWKTIFDQLLNYNIPGEEAITESQGPQMMLIYGLGFIAVNLVLALLYWHAYRQRDLLELTETEKFDTISVGATHLLSMLVGVISIIVALATTSISLSGYTYFLVPVFVFIFRSIRGRQRPKMTAEGTFTSTPLIETAQTAEPVEKKEVSGQ